MIRPRTNPKKTADGFTNPDSLVLEISKNKKIAKDTPYNVEFFLKSHTHFFNNSIRNNMYIINPE